ncbi:MAG: diguanylate cyclase [Rubrivivax sp.]|nr:diguanylate cyclase [Rubrivivax sp.]MDH5338607.1 diguanylate cyclase [Rubrivivax sp.]
METDLFGEDRPASAPAWRDRLRVLVARANPVRLVGSLKARLALGVLAALLLGMAGTALQLSAAAEADLLLQARTREQARAELIAGQVERRTRSLHATLRLAAQRLGAEPTLDAGTARALLGDHLGLLRDFTSVFVADAEGRMLLSLDASGSTRPAVSLREVEFFRRTMAQSGPVVSAPTAEAVSGEPIVVFTQPVTGAQGVRGVIGGTLRLDANGLLRDLGPADAGDPALTVIADSDGTVLAHPNRPQLLQSLNTDPRLAPAYRAWLASLQPRDFLGRIDASGDHLVAMASAGSWQVWRALDTQRELMPLRAARTQALKQALGWALALTAATVLFLVWQLMPLRRLQRRAAALLAGDESDDWPEAGGEIGQLSRTLRHVWAERAQVGAFNAEVLRKLGSVMAAAPVGLLFTRNQRFELVSADFCKLAGRAEHDLVGQSMRVLFVSDDDYLRLDPEVREAFADGRPYAGDWQMQRADGSRFWAHLRAQPVASGDPAAGTIWSMNDVTDQVQSRRMLEHAARHDPLTGAVNRQGFEIALQGLFNDQPGTRPASVLMIDLDHFKPINDTAGHAAGDAMLVAVTQAIGSRVRGSDVVARLGGDEFAVLLPNCNQERALDVAEKVRQAITALRLTWEAHTLQVGASLGVAELSERHENPAQWVAQADQACYEAKRAGRGAVRPSRTPLRVVSG